MKRKIAREDNLRLWKWGNVTELQLICEKESDTLISAKDKVMRASSVAF